ncbi:superfamily II DNA and RNA helicase [Microbacterium testaceum StLB037]|uniref:Superfamily II DNA and RNA helicase n=1 Tax=Microbacterium testaceum (strain StLB037) TaxID=979556 RepID=E8NGI7_MICTS|nr:DEAD/DEAH box helicase [Microbacterium testaceum]BAJ74070.1 superfamily II DNA and RNA helicase [Microbacterium testaceum StLB037]
MTSQTFADLGVPAPLIDVLAAQGKNEPFPIQADTLPDTLAGRDVLGRGKTGSGKTLAFSLPLVARLAANTDRRRGRKPRALVLAPTRELANQIDEVIKPLAQPFGLVTTTVYGGVNQKRQVDALNAGVDILVACPGRLEDLIGQGFANLGDIEITVLDEADHMADLGFLPGVTRLLARTPADGQRLLFSATLDNGVDKLVKRFLRNEVLHSVDEAHSHVAAMTHHVFAPADADAKKDLVQTLASGTARRILFMRTKHQAKKLAKQLTASGIPAVDLHGNLSQPARDRNLAAFGDGRAKVLVATDVAARGVHVDGVELVVHVDPPVEHKAYLHRSGRTARAGSAGDVVTIMLPEQRRDTLDILRKAKISATPTPVTSTSPEVVALVGEVAPYVKPEPIVAQPQGGGRSQGANAQRKRAARGEGQQPSGRGGAQGGGGRRRGAGAPASDAPVAGRAPQGSRGGQRSGAGRGQGAGGAQRPGAGAARPQGAGRSASGAPTTGMVVGARTPRTNRRAQG